VVEDWDWRVLYEIVLEVEVGGWIEEGKKKEEGGRRVLKNSPFALEVSFHSSELSGSSHLLFVCLASRA